MENKIRIAAVSYLNTKPFLFGIENSAVKNDVLIERYSPAVCAEKLLNDEADLGLIPVAVIPLLKEAHIITDYCIGAVGKVNSVLIVSHQPIEKIQKLYLDYQSRTSVMLAKVLLKHHWKLQPELIDASPGFENSIADFDGAVIIGDRALQLKDSFEFVYDLSKEWQQFSNLPFVFACWVSNKKLPQEFIANLNSALKFGVTNIDALILNLKNESGYLNDTEDYLKHNISFEYDDLKKEALQKFWSLIKSV